MLGGDQRHARLHSLPRDHQRSHGKLRGRQRQRWSDSEQRGNSEDRGWHNEHGKDDKYEKEGEWTEVISRRSAKARKKNAETHRTSDNHDTRSKPSEHYPNWRYKDDITSFYFTHFPDEANEVTLWENFKRWGDVREVYIAKRRNKDGRRYGFVRFKGVSDVKRLEVYLDNIFIKDQKLFVNIPRFVRPIRPTRTQVVQSIITKGGEQKKNANKGRQEGSIPRMRSYAEVTAKGGVSGNKVTDVASSFVLSIPTNDNDDYWCNGAWVGKLKTPMAMESMEDRISWDFGYNVRTKFLGDDMVLLTGLSNDTAQQIISSKMDGGKSIFYSLEKWRPGLKPNNRVIWIQLWGFPIEVWNTDNMRKLVACIGDVIEPDDDTEDRRRLDRARLLVRTPLPPTITKLVTVRLGNIDHNVWMVEEIGEDGDARHKRNDVHDDWTDEIPSDDGHDGADDDASDTTFSFSPELSVKKTTHGSNHWSHDITSGLGQGTVTHFSLTGNNTSDDTRRKKSAVRDDHNRSQPPLLANVDSAKYPAEKITGVEAPEKETSTKAKAGSWQEDGDLSGNILNVEGSPQKVFNLNGESLAAQVATGLHLDKLSTQLHLESGPSTKLGPIGKSEGCNKNIYPSKAHLAKESPDMFSKVYSRQRSASARAISLEPVAEEPNLIKEGIGQQHVSGLIDNGPKSDDSEKGQLSINAAENNSQAIEQAKQQWCLAKILGVQAADMEQEDGIHSFANMEYWDRKEAMELGNRKILR